MAMVWVDRIVGEIQERFVQKIARKERLIIRDEKTLSGRAHVGTLRGIAIHGLLAQVLTEQGIPNVFHFELNDFDPMDEIPRTLERSAYEKFMGQPLFTVPAPKDTRTKNYPTMFSDELQSVVERLTFPLSFYELQPVYAAGKFNEVIRTALDHASEIRAIYKDVSGSVKPDDWFPLQVICERCGKVGTTQVTAWNGSEVTYECKKDLVTWAQGCGHRGVLSPFDGRAKLPWKVEWPAKWKVFSVDIEGAGKDHGAAGGSRDIGRRITEEIFHYPEPFNIPYEFFNLGGKKMSASKGIGASAKEISDLLPPTLLRLLLIRKLPSHPIDFDPEGTTIPSLFDEYDRLADHSFGRHPNPDADYARTFALCQVDFPKPPKDLWQMRFSTVSFVVQMPHLSLAEEAETLKGDRLSAAEDTSLQERARFVKLWLQQHAPEAARYCILSQTPAIELTAKQRSALSAIHDALKEKTLPWEGSAIHAAVHSAKEQTGLEPRQLFEPLYQMLLGRSSGPQMGWFLSTFRRDEILKRINTILSSFSSPRGRGI